MNGLVTQTPYNINWNMIQPRNSNFPCHFGVNADFVIAFRCNAPPSSPFAKRSMQTYTHQNNHFDDDILKEILHEPHKFFQSLHIIL
jgi:hypothetical protein